MRSSTRSEPHRPDAGQAAVELALSLPLVQLAELASLFILVVFALVNASLFLVGRRAGAPEKLRRWRFIGLLGAALSLGLVLSELAA